VEVVCGIGEKPGDGCLDIVVGPVQIGGKWAGCVPLAEIRIPEP
jgi:hypothetical protein